LEAGGVAAVPVEFTEEVELDPESPQAARAAAVRMAATSAANGFIPPPITAGHCIDRP
jgi:hypothetical protein